MKKLSDIHGRILIADDEKLNVDFFHVMLTKLGFEVEVAYDGEEVLEKVEEFTPDLILLDLLMPKLSGYQVAEILKKDDKTKTIPIIVLTAVHDIKDKVDMIELGIEDYITKPFNFVEILARIRNNLKAKLLRDEMISKEEKLSSVARLEGSILTFLEKVGSCTDKINKTLAELKKNISKKDPALQKIDAAVRDLFKGIEAFKDAYKTYKDVNH
jgi:DNA-binding response OmpR family regulator